MSDEKKAIPSEETTNQLLAMLVRIFSHRLNEYDFSDEFTERDMGGSGTVEEQIEAAFFGVPEEWKYTPASMKEHKERGRLPTE